MPSRQAAAAAATAAATKATTEPHIASSALVTAAPVAPSMGAGAKPALLLAVVKQIRQRLIEPWPTGEG